MARWNEFIWDDGTIWDKEQAAPAGQGELTWILLIDWKQLGSFTGENEANYMTGCTIRRGREFYVAADGKGFDTVRIGSANIVLENKDGRYDPYNASSPLYDNIRPGRYAQLMVKINATGITYLVLTGRIADIKPITGKEQVRLEITDGLRELYDVDVTCGPNFYTNISQAINDTLDAAAWPVRFGRSIISNPTPITMYELDEKNAGDNIHQLAAAGLGTFFVARDGKATFYPRTYGDMPSYDLDQTQLLKTIPIPQPWEVVRNYCTVVANKQAKQRLGAIWYLDQPVYIAAGDSEIFDAQYDPSLDAHIHEMTANTAINGSGTDLTSSFAVTIGIRGSSATITIKNNSGSSGYLTKLVLDGRKFVQLRYGYTKTDAISISEYGSRRFVLDTEWLQDINFAKAYATILKDFLKNARKIPVVEVEQRPDLQFAPELFDKVHLTIAAKGIDDATLHISMIEHDWLKETGQGVTTKFYLQPLLYDTTSITPAPRDPDLSEIPEVPSDVIGPGFPGGWGIPTVPIILDCINDFHAGQNQYALMFSKSNPLAGETITATLACHLRASQTYNGPSFLRIEGTWPEDLLTTVVVTAAVNGLPVATAVRDAGSGKFIFHLPSPVAATGFSIRLPAGWRNTYAIGAVLRSGTVAGNSTVGAEISGLIIGQCYALESTGGPWYAHNSELPIYCYDVDMGGGFSGDLGYDVTADTFLLNAPTGGYQPEAIDSYHARFYFIATTPSIKFRVYDSGPYNDNSGTLGWILREATVPFTRGSQLITGTVAAISTYGVLATSGLTPGDYVCVEGYGSFDAGGGITGSTIQASIDGGVSWSNQLFVEHPYSDQPLVARKYYQVGALGTVHIRVEDSIFNDNSGSMTWTLYRATSTSARQITTSIHNICA